MSGIDPFAAVSADVNAAILADAAALGGDVLTLGIPVDVLQAQLSVGDVLAATILAPQGGVDLLEILGQRVVAQLPPDVHPGETLLLQVTAFAGNRIFVSNLGPVDPENPVPVVNIPAAPEPAQTATLTTIAPANTAPPEPAPSPPQTPPSPPQTPPAQQAPPVSPPRAVFVAASVRPAQGTPPQATPPQTALEETPPVARSVADVEARIFAARATQHDAMSHAAAQSASTLARVPLIAERTPVPAAAPVTARSPEAAMLSTLRVPQTQQTLAAARIAAQAVAMLPRVLQRLDAVLPRVSSDARISTLRTLLTFVSRLDPANERALPQQISAFVDNVLDGAESKLTQLVRAYAGADITRAPVHPQEAAAQQGPQPPAIATRSATQAASQASTKPAVAAAQPTPAQSPIVAGARAAERSVALDHDLKTLIMSLVRQPAAQGSPELAPALRDALTALTGAQLGALSVNSNNAATMAFSVPVFFHEGGQPAHIQIDRDGPGRKEKLDADNFHVAFVLDTATLGTVAIDLETVGRQVKVNVKTEREPAASRFKSTLAELGKRLEHLRYRVTSMNASVAPNATAGSNANAATSPHPVTLSPSKGDSNRLDLQA